MNRIPYENLQKRIMKYVREHGPVPRTRIAADFGVSKTLITQATNYLIKRNLIKEEFLGKSTKKGGRRPVYLNINSERGYLLSIDVGAYEIKGGIGNLKGEIVRKEKVKTDRENTFTQLINFSNELVKDYRKSLIGICVGIPGVVDVEKGIVIFSANLPTLNNINLKEFFEKKFKTPVKILSNSICGFSGIIAILEEKKEFLRGNIFSLWWSYGIGANILYNLQEIITGKTKYKADFGHITIVKRGILCKCGKRGCLESYVGTEALLKKCKRILKKEISIEDMINLAYKEKRIRKIFEDAGYLVGRTLSILIQYSLPELVCFGGGIIRHARDIVIPFIKKGLKDTMDAKQFNLLKFKVIDDEYFGVKGGIRIMTDEIFSNHFYKIVQI